MRIAVIGAGSVGRALASAFGRLGHDVRVGVRDPDDPRHGGLTARATTEEAVDGAEVVVLAVPAGALPDLLASLSLAPPAIVVDATNAVGGPAPGGASTVGAFVRSAVPPEVPVVKAFNTIGAEHMVDGQVGGVAAFLPVAGDAGGLDVVVDLARSIGFDAVPLGGIDAVEMVENHARLWIHLMRSGWGRDFGFAVVGAPTRTGGK